MPHKNVIVIVSPSATGMGAHIKSTNSSNEEAPAPSHSSSLASDFPPDNSAAPNRDEDGRFQRFNTVDKQETSEKPGYRPLVAPPQ